MYVVFNMEGPYVEGSIQNVIFAVWQGYVRRLESIVNGEGLRVRIHKFGDAADFAGGIDAGEDA